MKDKPIGVNVLDIKFYQYDEDGNDILNKDGTTKEFRLKSNSKLAYGMKPKNDSARLGTHRKIFTPYLLRHGWKWKPTMFIGQGCKTHLRYDDLPMGILICSISRHIVTIKDKVIHDTYDCSRDGTRCVYGYFYK